MKVTVYGLPSCVQCRQTEKYLDKKQIPYNKIDLSTNEEALLHIKQLGYRAAPVVVVEYNNQYTTHWSGFNMDRLSSIS